MEKKYNQIKDIACDNNKFDEEIHVNNDEIRAILDNVNKPEDIKSLHLNELILLADEIRSFLIDHVSVTGGHLASNLGVVELTLSLHRVFDSPKDKIIWDVGHQSYVHKILTGRKYKFKTLRQQNGLSGFPKTTESVHDHFNTGHSSTSISAALGMAKARDIKNENHSIIAVIGDGAMTGGMAFEALNDAGRHPSNLIIIVNDNEMSISQNVGGMSKYLSRIRTEPLYFKVKEDLDYILTRIPAIGKPALKAITALKDSLKHVFVPGVIFEELGFKYFGPVDGHNIPLLVRVLSKAKNLKKPVVIHVCTKKGKGYCHAEEKPHKFHGTPPFNIETGESTGGSGGFSDAFGDQLVKIAEVDKAITAITASMTSGTGLDKFSKTFPDRLFDVGIAEGHAVTFSAGLAISGLKPVFAVYSSFLQRGYDQLIHDIALQKLHVVFCIDRAGVVGEDGETHQGIYDLSYLTHIPNMTILAPCDYFEMREMLRFATEEHTGPVAIRYPRGKGKENISGNMRIELGKGVRLKNGTSVTLLATGIMFETALFCSDVLETYGITVDLINPRFIKPLDEMLIIHSVCKTGKLVTLEDNCVIGGFGSLVSDMLSANGITIDRLILGFPDKPIYHGNRTQILKQYGLDIEGVVESIKKFVEK
jgi:1-deoxy-D-xylulose-5-phosphate synthase